ncbi:hypothetical protein GALMADRAFT_225678 [Galerina marginata CBS 339.88]|uniref:Terpene synthase n=1 Tax=Galerina marginata (strain CBS 339.88) TaxID=685588 RepID=A0A067T0W2_GALM3|nr:hypothetical protein GALMADRAFT_225678 [Galerina marginata CBS 339.88]
MTTPQTFRLPRLSDTFSVFPDNGLNPHYSECRLQSKEWASKYYKAVCGPNMTAYLGDCNFELLAAYAYPYAKPEGIIKVMDYYNITWIFDEFTDTLPGKEAAEAAAIVSRTLRNRDYDDGSWLCQIMTDYRRNHIDKLGPNVARRFVEHFCNYVEGTGTEAELREKNQVLDISGYIAMRREAVAAQVAFDLVEDCLGLDLPQYVHEDPAFVSGYMAGVDLIALNNDMVSYNMEQSKGHGGANIVTVVMNSKGIGLQSAMDFVHGYCECITQQLLNARISLLSRPDPVFSRDATRCLEAFGDWIRGYDEWNFAIERYFGKQTKLVQEKRIVELMRPFQGFMALKD